MREPTVRTIKRLFALSGNNCTFPSCKAPLIEADGTVTGEICHIKARSPDGPRFDAPQGDEERHGFGNLVLLCPRHHKTIDGQPETYTVETLLAMKFRHERGGRNEVAPEDEFHATVLLNRYRHLTISHVTGPVIVDSPGAVGAHNVTIKTEKKTVKVIAPDNTIGSDIAMRGYAKYLIDRYNEFAATEPDRKRGKKKFSYAVIYGNITKKFGVKWELIPKSRFSELVGYLKGRIDRTWMSRVNKGKGHRSYRSFDEWRVEKLRD